MRDHAQAEVVETLRSAHISVLDLADVPRRVRRLANLPDLIAGGMHQKTMRPTTILIEVKSPGGKLRDGQREFLRWWRGAAAVVWSGEEALALFGIEPDARPKREADRLAEDGLELPTWLEEYDTDD